MDERYEYYDGGVYDMRITGYIDEASEIGFVGRYRESRALQYEGVVPGDEIQCKDFVTHQEALDWVIATYEAKAMQETG